MDRNDHDARLKMDTARILGKDAIHGKLMNQLQGRIKHEYSKLDELQVKKRKTFDFSLHLVPGKHKTLFAVDEGQLTMGEKLLSFNAFELKSEGRAALTGINGSGKSTLLRHIYGFCRKKLTLYIPQELDEKSTANFFARINSLSSGERGEIYSIMAALGSEPERVLAAERPSPGEIRKLLIADAVRKKLELLILDEPTNHLDLDSIEALEAALREYRAGLVLVSHDKNFLEYTTDTEWRIEYIDDKNYSLSFPAGRAF